MMKSLLAAPLAVAALACSEVRAPATERGPEGPPLVLVTFAPTETLAHRLAGDLARVECDLPADVDPLFWHPDDAALARFQAADLVVLHGAGMDAWADTASLPESRVVRVAERFQARWIQFDTGVEHAHGGGTPHRHVGVDPHAWMDPLLWLEEARAVHEALVRTLGEAHRAALDGRLAGLEADLRALHEGWSALRPPAGETLYASHPAYDYLAARHHWPVANLDLDPAEAPDAQTLDALRAALSEHPGRTVLWEAEPCDAAREALAELGLRGVVVSPGETLTAEQRAAGVDALDVQRANLERLRTAWEEGR